MAELFSYAWQTAQ